MHLLNALPQRLDPGATPTFAGLISATLTSPAATNLTLAGGAGNSSVILTPAGTGNVGIGTASPNVKLELGLGTISNVEPNQYLRVNAGTYNSAISANLDLLCWGNNFTNSLGWRLSSVNLAGVSTARDLTFNSLVDGGSGIVGAATERMRIASATGNVSIASSTAGSSGAGALVVSGGLATGAASYIGGALTVIGVAENISAQFGSSTSSQIYIRDNTINCASGNNGAETLRFNYVGYNNGTTQFRNSVFHDGKAAVVATFTGSDKSATFAGAVTVNADAFSFLDLPTGIFRNGSTGYISSDPNEGAIFSTNAYFNTNWTGTGSGAYIYLGKSGGASQQKIFFGRTSSGAPTTTITFDVSTGAATFTGAVEIGNTVNTVSPTSPNRTVTMVVNGVTLYLAAKTTND